MKKELVIIGFLLLALIFLFIDFDRLFEILVKTDLFFFFLGVFFGFPAAVARSAKWFLMLKKQGYNFPIVKIVKYYYIGIGLGTFTPGRLGDFAKALYVDKKINSLSKSFSSVLVDRVIDLGVLVFIGIMSCIAIIFLFGVTIISIPLIAGLALSLSLAFYLLFNKALLKRVLRPFYRFLVPERFKERLSSGFDSFIVSVQQLLKSPGVFFYSTFFSLLSWVFAAISYYFLALALGISLSFAFLFLILSLSTLVLLLPLSFSGIGTRDALLILLFSLQNISAEQAVAFSFLVLFSSIVHSVFGVALVATEKLELKKFLGEKSEEN